MNTYYKILKNDGSACHGGTGKWFLPKDGVPGEWMPMVSDVKLCERGYHVVKAEHIINWLNEAIFEVEVKGLVYDEDEGKGVCESARLLRQLPTWNERTMRLFAADCAEHVLHFYEEKFPDDSRPRKAIEVVRRYANGEATLEELISAWDAASAAAYAAGAAGDAAYVAYAARDAARDAARAAAWDAAWAASAAWDASYAARDAANAAGDAAWDAANAAG